MIVDDRPDNLRLLSQILASEGYKVRKVLDGNHALDAAQLDPPDLILLDIMMPEMDGYEVCRRLKGDERTQTIPVLFLSALDVLEDKIKAFSVGGVDYITKPFQKEEVVARVSAHLQIQALTQALKSQNTALTEEIEQRKVIEADLKKALQDLKNAQEQIISREKLASLGTLATGIAHELRNPLNFVNNYAEGSIELADELSAELEQQLAHIAPETRATIQELMADLRENAIAIYQHGQRAERIINSMMQHARTGISPPQQVDLNALLAQAIDWVYHSRRATSIGFNIVLETDYDPAIGEIEVLPNQLSRALINLIDNAFYALQKKQERIDADFTPRLEIATRKLHQSIEIRIRDNGLGIAPENRSKIFEPFFTTKPAGEGTGLGLSMTHEIITKQHGGTLTLETEPNVYTEFIIRLPQQENH